MLNIPCVIFAGGKSSRMGEDKSLLPFGSFDTLTQYQLSKLSKIFKTVYISCKDKSKFDFEADFIEDVQTDDVFAPTAGFVAIFEKLKTDRFFAISVDAPFISEKEINQILHVDTSEYDATIAKTTYGIQPMCGIYHRSLQNEFVFMLKNDNHRLSQLLKTHKTNIIFFEDEKPFLNLNHPHEYKEAVKISYQKK